MNFDKATRLNWNHSSDSTLILLPGTDANLLNSMDVIALQETMESLPGVRDHELERVQALLEDENYPSDPVIEKISALLAHHDIDTPL